MRVDVNPRQVDIVPGQAVFLTVVLTNTSTVIGGYTVRMLGVDPSWVSMDHAQISLFPDEVRVLPIAVTPPAGLAAGVRRIAVQVRELTPPNETAIAEVDFTVPEAKSIKVRVDPVAVTAGRRAGFSVIAENTGNTIVTGRLAGDDPENKVSFLFDPEILHLAPGEHAVVDMTAKARRHFTGTPTVRPLGVYLDEFPSDSFFAEHDDIAQPRRGDDASVASATFVQKTVLSRGALSLVGLLVAVTVFAIVITLALGRLVGQTTADRNLALQVAAARDGGTNSGTSSVSGTVTLLASGNPLSAVSVSIFSASDTTKPIATTATDQTGSYTVPQLAAGKYKISFARAGYIPLWFPAATSDADATAVELKAGEQKHGLNVGMSGQPATITGTVVGDDVSASTLYLETVPQSTGSTGGQATNAQATAQLPAADQTTGSTADPFTGGNALVQKVPVGADGTFTLTDVPSPNVYVLVVVKTGYATTRQTLDVSGGEDRTGVEIPLRKGDGVISGTITDSTHALGGVTVTANSGTSAVTTVSLTDSAHRGEFALRNLPTPGSFTITASLAGHASQTLTLTLASGQSLTGVQITLGTSSGALTGVVDDAKGPAKAVTVTATDGLLTVQTQTESDGNAGQWHIGGLPVPGTYTLTFSRADLTPQTLSVSLDASGTIPVASGVLVDSRHRIHLTMSSATTTLSGVVHRTCAPTATLCVPSPLAEATVTLNSGTATYTVTTAGTPSTEIGHYEIDNLPPGTYTLSASTGTGTAPSSQVVNLVAGVPAHKDIALRDPASISGTLTSSSGTLSGWTVFLYTTADYPTTFSRSVVTGPDGTFSINDIDAGDYLLALSPTADPSSAVETVHVTVQPGTEKTLGLITVSQ